MNQNPQASLCPQSFIYSLEINWALHSVIQSFSHSVIQSFSHSVIQSFSHSVIQQGKREREREEGRIYDHVLFL
jgi:hypothetical protein